MKTGITKSILNVSLLVGFSISVNAQKLPDVQEKKVPVPADLKIDGKNKEWNNSFQALNKRNNIYYTLTNDDNNLYLVIKSADAASNNKILAGGITFSVNPDGKKKENESISLTYPIVPRPNFRGGQGDRGSRRAMGMALGMGGGNNSMSQTQRDSAMAAMQKTQLALVKEISIKRFKNTTDTLVSIYNEYGIKAFSSIGDDHSFFCEFAIPLSAFGLSAGSSSEIAYNIKLNGLQLPGGLDGGNFGGGGGGGGRMGGGGFGGQRGGGGNGGSRGGIDFQELMSPTDFWGKYTLGNKK